MAVRVIRKLFPTDRLLFRDHLLRLAPGDRLSRFIGVVSDQTIDEYCNRIDWIAEVVLGCFINGKLRAAVELKRDDGILGSRGEISVSVEEAWQGQKIGTELMRRMLNIARNRGLTTVYLLCMAENRRMQRIVRRFEGACAFDHCDVEGDIKLSFPTPQSILNEISDDLRGVAATVIAQWTPVVEGFVAGGRSSVSGEMPRPAASRSAPSQRSENGQAA